MNLTRHENMTICGKDNFIASYANYYSLTEHTPVEIIVLLKRGVIFKQYVPKKHEWFEIKKNYNYVILNNIGLYKYDFMQAKIRNVSQ